MLPFHPGVLRDQSSEPQPAGRLARPRQILAEPDKRARRYRSTVRRRLLTIAIFLLAGAVVNVAVAWGCAVWLPFEVWRPGTRQPGGSREYAIDFIRRNLSADPDVVENVHYYKIRRHGALYFAAIRERTGAPPYGYHEVVRRHVFAWGWPLLSLWCEHERVNVNSLTSRGIYRVHGGIETSLERITLVGSGGPYARVLPIRPIRPGFAANTAFYAGIVWLLIPGPFALRRLIRQRRGFCLACGYDLRHGEHEACPECGVMA